MTAARRGRGHDPLRPLRDWEDCVEEYLSGRVSRVPPAAPGSGERLRVIGGARCWCGLPGGHPWPGKGGGAPHPR